VIFYQIIVALIHFFNLSLQFLIATDKILEVINHDNKLAN